MKKIGALLLTLATVFSLVACKKKKTTKDTTTAHTTTEEGPINPDDYLTPNVEGNMLKNGNFNETNKETAQSGDQFIGNWWLYGLDGGYGVMEVTNKHELEIAVMKESNKEYCIQLAYDGFKIYQENKYVLEFDGYATYNRHFEVRVQENGDDYTNYMLEDPENDDDIIVELGTEKRHYKFEFTSHIQDLAPRFVLNLGWFEGDDFVEKPDYIPNFDDGTITTIPKEFLYFDNFVMKCTYDAGIRIDPLARPMITLNQVGFLTNQVKEAVFRKDPDKGLDTAFDIINVTTNESVYSASVTPLANRNESSNEICGYADFSAFKTPGTYKIVGNNTGESYKFTISESVYNDLANDTIMMLYKQRCGEVLAESETDKFAHEACHQDKATVYGTSTKLDVSGGWHDAGDYGKYVVAGAQTVADLLLTYEKYGNVFTYDNYVTGTDNTIPDILEEAMWELDWMLKMQKDNGEVYHKVTTLDFPENKVSALDDTAKLYIAPASYAATADFAAVMAKAAYILKTENIATEKATAYENAAKNAYAALANMSKTSFKNPTDIDPGKISTGEYPDSELDDELTWASIELYFLTGTKTYLDAFYANYSKTKDFGLGWANVNGFAIETYLLSMDTYDENYDTEKYETIRDIVISEADKLLANIELDVYNVSIGKKKVTVNGVEKEIWEFDWGSNLAVANNAMILEFASWLVDDPDTCDTYMKGLEKQVNYLLGQNANCYCFVTGYGTLSPVNPHHRPSIIAGSGNPMVGMLVGGPDSNFAENGNDAIATNNCEDSAPALCYIDHNNSWSTNEVTIYWNSPFTYVMYALIGYYSLT